MNLLFLILGSAVSISLCWADDIIVLEPVDPFVFIGECITFNCTLSSMRYGNSSSLYMSFHEEIFPNDQYEIVDEKTMKLKWCIKDLEKDAAIYCKLRPPPGVKKLVFAGQIVHFEKALVPIPVHSIKSVSDFWNFNFSWNLGQTYVKPDRINVSFKATVPGGEIDCPKLTQLTCQFTGDDLTMQPLAIKLKVSQADRPDVDNITTNLNLISDIPVKPSKVESAGVNSVKANTSCFDIRWKKPKFYHRLKFNITLISELHEERTEIVRGRHSHLIVCDLLPGGKYKIYISAIPRRDPGIPSDPLILHNPLESTYPSRAPSLTNSSFRWTEDRLAVILYWKCLTRKEYGADQIWYLVEIENKTTLAESGKTPIKLPLDKKCWFIKLWPKNHVGLSKTSSSITICNDTLVPPIPEDVEILINKTHVEVMWERPKTSVSGFQILAYRNCSVDLLWWDVDANQSSVLLEMEDVEGYSFSVAAVNSEGSSGLTNRFCSYLMKRPQNPIDGLEVEPSDEKLKIEWEPYNCEVEKAYVIKYNIKYCTGVEDSGCHDEEKVETVPRREKKFRTSQLRPDNYLVWIEPVTYGGSGPSSQKLMVHVPDTSMGLGPIIAMGLVIPVALIFVILGFIYVIHKCRSGLAECNPEVITPKIPDHLAYTRTDKFNSDGSTNSGKDDSPTSSAITDITNLTSSVHNSSTSLHNPSSYESTKHSPHQYVQLDDNSSDSQSSTTNSNENMVPPQPFNERNSNNNAFTQEVTGEDDYVPFDLSSKGSDLSRSSSKNSGHRLLPDSASTKVPEFSNISDASDIGGSLKHALNEFVGPNILPVTGNSEGNLAAADGYVQANEDGILLPQDSFKDTYDINGSLKHALNQFVGVNMLPGTGNSEGNLAAADGYVQANEDGILLPQDLRKDAPNLNETSQINDCYVLENFDCSSKKEVSSDLSGEKSGDDVALDEMNDMSYVRIDGSQTPEKVFNSDEFCLPKVAVTNIMNNCDDYVYEDTV